VRRRSVAARALALAVLAGIEAGAFTDTWPRAQYRDLSITRKRRGIAGRLTWYGM
jgi:hypothetical protein